MSLKMTLTAFLSWVSTSLSMLILIVPVLVVALHPLRRLPGSFWSKICPLPLIIQCRKARRSAWILEQHEKHGVFVRIAPDHVSIADPQALNQIYGHKTGFLKEPVLFNTRDMSIHQRKRKYVSPAFSARNLQDFEEHMNPSITRLVQYMQKCVTESKSFDFCRWSNFLAFDVIGEYSFGSPFGFLESGRDDYNLIHTIDTRGEVLNAMGHLPRWMRPYMKYVRIDPFFYKGLRSTASLEAIGRAAFGKRKEDTSTARKDLMSFLLNAKDPDTGDRLPDKEILAEAISFIVGGSDTTSSTMTNFMDFVSRDQKLQADIYTELLEAFPGSQDSDWVASEEVSGKLRLLNATLKEVMRLRPTSSTGLERVVPEGGRVVAGTFIPAGFLVSVPTVAIHHNTQIYRNPEKLDPQRWLVEDASDLTNYFVPFSTGPRACVGRNFAWMEMLKTLATIFRLFQFERTISVPSESREGFFVKVIECNVRVGLRASK
ncbi:cytochrome P450 [Lophium mytilinum]|uniref:Cytochrome P450 n=1 Tax=Lophium mytilinum TaxID=390894 RepID=A0A6A6RAE3_9PEZI|nr:cytochrome P450 [Lophium mytilinum]